MDPRITAASIDPPPERAEVYRPGEPSGSFLDEFEGATLDPRWRTRPAEAVRLLDGEVVLEFGAAEGTELSTPLSAERSQLWTACVRYSGDDDRVTLLALGSKGTRIRLAIERSAGSVGLRATWEVGGEFGAWTPDTGWSSSDGIALATDVNDVYFTVGLEIQVWHGRPRLRFLCWNRASDGGFDQGYRLFLTTGWLDWDDVLFPRDRLRLSLGDGSGRVGTGSLYVEWVRFADGPRVEAWANGKRTAQGNYDTRHWWSYDGDLFVPAQSERAALPHGGEDEWDGHYAKDAWVVQDVDGVYYMFHSGKPRGGNYGLGVAYATHVNGPWTKYAGNPLLEPRPGTDESGLQFPTVVCDPDNPDPDRRWQMLYDGYGFDPVRHGMFLATAPHPFGPWTRRGLVLGRGEPGSFDDLGCAGGVPIYWEGKFEVWYPALRKVGETGIWSIGRAVGNSLAELERDGFGARVTQQPHGEGRVDGPIRGRFVPLDDTRGFERDGMVLLTDDGVKNNYVTSRVRRVTQEGIELYHPVSGLQADRLALARQFDRASLWPRFILRAGDEWRLYINLFGTFRGAEGGLQAFDENTALLGHGGEHPTSETFHFDWPANPPIARGVRNNDRSSENISLISVPVRR